MKVKWIRYNRKKVFIGLFLFLVLVGLTFGYAFITTKLTIDGIAKVKDAKWDIHFTNLQPITGSVSPEEEPTVTNTSVTFSAKVDEPGDFYGFTVDVINQGTINAEIGNISVTPDFSAIDYIDATIAYDNGDDLEIGDILLAGKTKTIKVLLNYKDGIDESLYPTTDQEFTVTVALNYLQHVGYAPNFATDSWSTIKANVKADKSSYNIGDTKTIEMDVDGDNTLETYTLRVANNTTPSECSQEGFSRTACGFVLEFQDIITTHRMNPNDQSSAVVGDGNKGGWEYSDMRAYINSGKYLEGTASEIDYSTSGLYDKIPDDLKNIIINTIVVSGYGKRDSVNFVTSDKLYLLSPHEVWKDVDSDPDSGVDYNDKAYVNTRQLDYYLSQEVTTSNYGGAIKKYNESNLAWWLRSASHAGYHIFFRVTDNANWGSNDPRTTNGVSPAFRIAE